MQASSFKLLGTKKYKVNLHRNLNEISYFIIIDITKVPVSPLPSVIEFKTNKERERQISDNNGICMMINETPNIIKLMHPFALPQSNAHRGKNCSFEILRAILWLIHCCRQETNVLQLIQHSMKVKSNVSSSLDRILQGYWLLFIVLI